MRHQIFTHSRILISPPNRELMQSPKTIGMNGVHLMNTDEVDRATVAQISDEHAATFSDPMPTTREMTEAIAAVERVKAELRQCKLRRMRE